MNRAQRTNIDRPVPSGATLLPSGRLVSPAGTTHPQGDFPLGVAVSPDGVLAAAAATRPATRAPRPRAARASRSPRGLDAAGDVRAAGPLEVLDAGALTLRQQVSPGVFNPTGANGSVVDPYQVVVSPDGTTLLVAAWTVRRRRCGGTGPAPAVPEVPWAVLLPVAALVIGAGMLLLGSRRRA